MLVHLDDQLLALVDERAARLGTSRSELVRAALEQYLKTEVS
jgi:metal-responsive CopG/Arc/MetJ family transcriptional regulator